MFFLKLSFDLEFYNLDNQTKKLCLYYTVYSNITFNSTKFCVKIYFTLSFCLGFANHVFQTNKLKTVHTLQCTLYTVHYVPHRPEFSTLETSEEGGHMGELLMWLISRLCWISMIGKLYSSFEDIYKLWICFEFIIVFLMESYYQIQSK